MSKPVRWLLIGLILLAVLAGLALLMVNTISPHGSIIIDDMDMSNSVLGWMIAIPVLLAVGMLLMVIFAGLGVVAAVAVAVALGAVGLALLVAMLPVLLFLAVPALALYGFIKLVTRPRRVVTTTAAI